MVTNRERRSFGSRRKNSRCCSDDWHRYFFDPRSGISGPTSRRASACPILHEWWTQPFKISSWIWSIISGVVTVLGRPGRGASQVEKSLRLNWATQFLTVAYDGTYFPNVSVRMAWISFGALPCKKKKLMRARVSMLLKLRASPEMLHFSLCNKKKDVQFGTWTDPSFQRPYQFRPTTWGSRSG